MINIKHLLIKMALYPFKWLYYAGVEIRNFLYDTHFFKTEKVPVFTISIGNLSVGGTGKTEIANLLIAQLLKNNIKPAYLSRGYKRKTKGFLLVEPKIHSVKDVGDEALMITKAFPEIPVAVCENRVEGAKKLLATNNFDVLILDDAFQHRKIHRDLDILSVNAKKFPWKDDLIPVGTLREPEKNIKRADLIFINKITSDVVLKDKEHLTPEEWKQECKAFYKNITHRVAPKPVVFTKYEFAYLMPLNMEKKEILSVKELNGRNVIMFSGIADIEYFRKMLTSYGAYIIKQYKFPDHHNFTQKQLKRIVKRYNKISQLKDINKQPIIITTEKDIARIWNIPELEDILKETPVYYTKIKMEVIHNREVIKNILNNISEKIQIKKKLITN